MKTMRKSMFKLYGLIVAMALLASPVFAMDLASHVSTAPNGNGDVLVYPLYLACDGIATNFHIINSSDTRSVVAKVVLRSHKCSVEVLDFLIYLSPNDYFDAKIQFKDGKYVCTITDDSYVVDGESASAQNPKEYELFEPSCDTANYGYIEVIEAWSAVLPKKEDGTVAKLDIVDAYDGVDEITNADTVNVLSGFAEIVFPGVGDYADYNAVALNEYNNNQILQVNVLTILGQGSNNSLCEVEAALAKNNLVIPYLNSDTACTIPIFTFPTKIVGCDETVKTECNDLARGPFFQGDNLDPVYGIYYYDKEEHTRHLVCEVSPCPETPELNLDEEVNLISLAPPFDGGWLRAVFSQTTACNSLAGGNIVYTGAPVMGLITELTADGLSLITPAYDYGTVSYDGVDVTGAYQTQSTNEAGPGPGPEPIPQCGGLDDATCGATDGCTWNAFPPPGECLLDCGQFTDQTSCEAGLGGGCEWQTTPFGDVCVVK